METKSTDERPKELEQKVERLQQFNQILLDHLLLVQGYGKAVAQNIPVWLIELSDALYFVEALPVLSRTQHELHNPSFPKFVRAPRPALTPAFSTGC